MRSDGFDFPLGWGELVLRFCLVGNVYDNKKELPMNLNFHNQFHHVKIKEGAVTAIDVDQDVIAVLNVDYCGLYIMLSGEAEVLTANPPCAIASGQVIYIKGGSYIIKSSTPIVSRYAPLSKLVVWSFIDGFSECFFLDTHFQPRSTVAADLISFPSENVFRHAMLGVAILSELEPPLPLYSIRISDFLFHLAKSTSGNLLLDELKENSNDKKLKLRIFMKKNLLRQWSVYVYAKEFGLSLSAFKELFQDTFLLPPKKWINEQRLQYARMLLMHSKLRIIDISSEIGFSNQSHFTQTYHKRFGYPPGKERSINKIS
ncbi:MAG: helix-turn-helix transcriptional regulator [Aeromonas veronii]